MNTLNTLIGKAQHDPRRHCVWIIDPFFGLTGRLFYAVVDDFGNLIAVEAL